MKKITWLLIVLIAVVFLSGAVAGFLAGRLTAPKRSRMHRKFSRSRKNMKAMFQKRICKRLKLTTDQIKSAQPIIDSWIEGMGKLRQQHAPQYELVFNKFYKEITPLLSTEQKSELDKWHKKFTKYSKTDKKGDNNASK